MIEYNGKVYRTKTALCEAYGVNRTTFVKRLAKGMSIEKALEPVIVEDFAGNQFQSVKAMLRFYNINKTTFHARLNAGWSLEDALTIPTSHSLRKIDNKRKFVRLKVPFTKIRCKDHIGNYFKSKQAMCKFWGIAVSTYHARRKMGWSLEKTLTEDIRRYEKI